MTVMIYAEMVEIYPNTFSKPSLVIMECICKSFCNSPAYLVITEVPRTGMGLVNPRMQANKVTSVNALSQYLAHKISPVYNCIVLQKVTGYQAM